MNAHRKSVPSIASCRAAWLAVLLSACPVYATAQTAPAPSSSAPSVASPIGMDSMHMDSMDVGPMGPMDAGSVDAGSMPAGSMPAMEHGRTPRLATPATIPSDAPIAKDTARSRSPRRAGSGSARGHHVMPGMADTSAMPRHAGHGESHADHPAPAGNPSVTRSGTGEATAVGMEMSSMQHGAAPPDARSPDYSDGVGYGSTQGLGMAMNDNVALGMLLVDQLEAFHGRHGNGQAWAGEGWYGNDTDKLWVRSEGERIRGGLEDGDVEAFWSHAASAFWDVQLGVRHDLDAPSRNWAAFGIQGLAPYWLELQATGYVGPSGRTAARFRAGYELLLTQRLILQPEFEVNLLGRSDPARRLGSGPTDARLGLRLRYEIHRQFAPYAGVVWTQRFGGTAAFARDEHQTVFDRRWVAGIRIWF